MAMAPHNDAGPECHYRCCGGPVEGCYCWMCEPDLFPWGKYDSVEDAARDWGRWYDGEPAPPMDDEEGEEVEGDSAARLGALYQKAADTTLLMLDPEDIEKR